MYMYIPRYSIAEMSSTRDSVQVDTACRCICPVAATVAVANSEARGAIGTGSRYTQASIHHGT
jgi:hypothetical protein